MRASYRPRVPDPPVPVREVPSSAARVWGRARDRRRADGETSLDLTVDEHRRWWQDGVRRTDLTGCVDVDVAATPLTNTFPIRRFAELAVGERRTTSIAWVEVPTLTVSTVRQTYVRLGRTTWEYSDPQHGAFVLEVDDDGLVLDYEGFARRVR